LKLALQWNRIDIYTELFTGDEYLRYDQKYSLFEMALIQDKPEFVELLLARGLNLNTFLNKKRLYYLYNSADVIEKAFFNLIFD
jgi:hypothetical protein